MTTAELTVDEKKAQYEQEGYKQVCIWPGTILNDEGTEPSAEDIKVFEDFIMNEFNTRIKFLEQVKTLPDKDEYGNTIANSGDRNDIFFVVHKEDIEKFAVPRLMAGIRWLEDAFYYNNHQGIYPKEVVDRYPKTW